MKTIISLVILTFAFLTGKAQSSDIWTQKSDFGSSKPNGQLTRTFGVGFSIGSKGYIGTGTGGVYSSDYKKDFWEYDPATNVWSQKADVGGVPRSAAVGFSIGSKGYIGTGLGAQVGDLKDFWEYNPATNSWTQKANLTGDNRYHAVGFCIGTKGYIGTGYGGTTGLKNDFWEYNPATDTWLQKANFSGVPRQKAAGFSISGKGYIGTGSDGGSNYFNDFWEYNPGTNTWLSRATIIHLTRDEAIGFNINDRGYICTGFDGRFGSSAGSYNQYLWEYNPVSNTWTGKNNFGGYARGGAVGFSIGNKAYVGSGRLTYNHDETATSDFWEFDQTTNVWAQKAYLGSLPRSTAIGFSISGKGYLGLGDCNAQTASSARKEFWEYDPISDTWTQKANFAGTARTSAVGFSIGSKGYVGTGVSTSGTLLKDFWEYNPVTNTWAKKADFGGLARGGAIGFCITDKGYIGTGNAGNDFWQYDPATNIWTQKASFAGTARSGAAGFSIGNKGYLGNGKTSSPPYENDFWEYDPASNVWTRKADYAVTGYYIENPVAFSIGGKGFMGTGNGYYGSQNDFSEYDPVSNTWTSRAYVGGLPRSGAVGFSIGSKGFIGTGYYSGTPLPYGMLGDFWEYTPYSSSGITTLVNTTSLCQGAAFPVSYSSGSVFAAGNIFTAQLSDASGSFAAPVSLGTLTSTSASGVIQAKLPAVQAAGTGYRIRVISSAPALVGTDNGANLSVLASPTTPAVTNAYFCNGASGSATLTASGGGTGITTYNWYATLTGGAPLYTGTSFTTPVVTATKTYYAAAVNTNGCESAVRKGGAVYVTPAFTVTATATSPSITVGGNTTLTAASSITGVTWKWSPATGLSSTTAASVTATPAVTTTYTLTGTKATCTSVATVTITVSCASAMSGTYTINKNLSASATNFTNIKAFADRLTSCGVSGPITATIASVTGPYTEQVEFGVISGVSPTNTVTLNGNGNTLQFLPTSTSNHLLRFNGTDYFRLQNLVITSTSPSIGWGVHLYNGADNNVISNCTINISATGTSTPANGIVASNSLTVPNTTGVTASYLQLLNNTINGGYYGISVCGDVTTKAAGVLISGNMITNAYYAGINELNLDAAITLGNTVSMRTGNINSYGLFLSSVDNGFWVQRNKVSGFGRYGLFFTNCNSTAVSNRAQVSNNMIGGGVQNSTAVTYGLYINNTDRVDLWHNSVNLDQGGALSAACYVLASSGAMDVRNNSFAFSGASASYAFYAPTASLTSMDYNNYYSTGTKFTFLGGDKADLTSLQSTVGPAGHDVHSYQGNPGYISSTNLHVQAAFTQLSNRGVAIAAAGADIDANTRTITPDIGADEYTAAVAKFATIEQGIDISAYPNPFREELIVNLKTTSEEAVQLILIDELGRTIEKCLVGTGKYQLVTHQLKVGIYHLKVRQGNDVKVIKVLKTQ